MRVMGGPGLLGLVTFGDENYSKEELVAEMGATFLCSLAGIENQTIDNSAAYISNWLTKLRSDRKLLVQAGSAAQKAVDFITNATAAAAYQHRGGSGDLTVASLVCRNRDQQYLKGWI